MKYDREIQIQKAISEISNGMSFREASKLYGIPFTTLNKRARGISSSKIGAPTTISQTVEKLMVNMIIFLAEIGFGLTQ
jgi:hypothetical protein